MNTNTDTIPVIYRTRIIGRATTERGALRIARRLHCQPYERRTVTYVEHRMMEPTVLLPSCPGVIDMGPAYFVGVSHK